MDYSGSVPRGHSFYIHEDNVQTEIDFLDSLYKKTNDLDYLSDKGLVLIIVKRYDEAIKLYLAIEKMKPNRYATASNLGTAYELTGQNRLALEWIKKAVKINPNSHSKSEWIHVRILEAKMQGLSSVNALSLINADFGKEDLPATALSKQKLSELSDAIYYQLNERISFIKPKDAIIAQLLFEYGNTRVLLGDNATASKCYIEAKEYGFTDPLLDKRYQKSQERIRELDSIIISNGMSKLGFGKKEEIKAEFEYSYIRETSIGVCVFLFGSIGLLWYKRKKKLATRNK